MKYYLVPINNNSLRVLKLKIKFIDANQFACHSLSDY